MNSAINYYIPNGWNINEKLNLEQQKLWTVQWHILTPWLPHKC